MTDFSILYEDSEILLVNKPCGVAVQGGEGIAHPLDAELSKQTGYKIHLVHRLDKETEGILIVAKNPQAASKWTKLIQTKEVQKEYYAVTLGLPVVNGKESRKGVLRSTVEAHGKKQTAETFFTVEKIADIPLPVSDDKNSAPSSEKNPERNTEKNKTASSEKKSDSTEKEEEKIRLCLVRLTLGTGRMHQLRIQLSQAKAPIAQDDLHGNFRLNKKIRKLGIKKLQLAAFRLTIPSENKRRVFEIPLPSHFYSFPF